MTPIDLLPDDTESLKRLLVAARAHAATVSAEAASLRAKAADDEALIAHLKLQIEKLRRERFGQRSERSARLGRVRRDLLDQLELQLEELEASATEDELAAEKAVARTTKVAAFTRKRPSRKPFPWCSTPLR